MNVTKIDVAAGTKQISLRITCPHSPQSLAGVLWRYDAALQPQGKVGEFRPSQPQVAIGSLNAVKDCNFLLEGVVISQNDDPATPYQVLADVLQDGIIIHEEVPLDGGAGSVGKKDVGFLYRFQIVEAK